MQPKPQGQNIENEHVSCSDLPLSAATYNKQLETREQTQSSEGKRSQGKAREAERNDEIRYQDRIADSYKNHVSPIKVDEYFHSNST